jgi:hypothetical protein
MVVDMVMVIACGEMFFFQVQVASGLLSLSIEASINQYCRLYPTWNLWLQQQ